MKIFITGATGYIGGSLAQRLIAEGHQVTGLVRSAARAAAVEVAEVEALVPARRAAGAASGRMLGLEGGAGRYWGRPVEWGSAQ